MVDLVIQALKDKKQTLGFAESCTGGLLSDTFVQVSGASEVYMGCVVAYHNEIKEKVLRIPGRDIEKYGAVSQQVACEMAQGIKKLFGCDWGFAVTGIAGPNGGTPDKPVGTVWICGFGPNFVHTEKQIFPGDRRDIQKATVDRVIQLLNENI